MSVLPVLLLLLQAVIHVHTQLVVVPAVVSDANGHLVSGLTQDNFRVSEDGHPVELVAFHAGDTSMTLGLIVDRSQSMRPKTAALFTVVSRLLQLGRPDDELFAVDFNDNVSLALPEGQAFTNVGGGILTAIAVIPAEGQTALYDGVALGLEHLQLGRAERHALVLVSDGGDNVSRRKYAEILALAVNLLENRRHHPAGPAPRCPEVNQHRSLGLQYLGVEVVVGDIDYLPSQVNLLRVGVGSRRS